VDVDFVHTGEITDDAIETILAPILSFARSFFNGPMDAISTKSPTDEVAAGNKTGLHLYFPQTFVLPATRRDFGQKLKASYDLPLQVSDSVCIVADSTKDILDTGITALRLFCAKKWAYRCDKKMKGHENCKPRCKPGSFQQMERIYSHHASYESANNATPFSDCFDTRFIEVEQSEFKTDHVGNAMAEQEQMDKKEKRLAILKLLSLRTEGEPTELAVENGFVEDGGGDEGTESKVKWTAVKEGTIVYEAAVTATKQLLFGVLKEEADITSIKKSGNGVIRVSLRLTHCPFHDTVIEHGSCTSYMDFRGSFAFYRSHHGKGEDNACCNKRLPFYIGNPMLIEALHGSVGAGSGSGWRVTNETNRTEDRLKRNCELILRAAAEEEDASIPWKKICVEPAYAI